MSSRFVKFVPANSGFNSAGSDEDNVIDANSIMRMRREIVNGSFVGVALIMKNGVEILTKNETTHFMTPNEQNLNA